MNKVSIREDFRRDGLCMNFLVNSKMMNHLAKAFPYSIFNIGYPAICSEEANFCKEITLNLSSLPVETAVVGHALNSHLKTMANISNLANNTSANFWIPFSENMIKKTLKITPSQLLDHTISMVKSWKNLSDRPIDIALVDATAEEENLDKRLQVYFETLKSAGVRSIIVCDTKGIANVSKLEKLFSLIKTDLREIEFHPHDDKKQALNNINALIMMGVKRIGTAVYGYGERASMIDPRILVKKYSLKFNQADFDKFEQEYKELIISLKEKEPIFTSDCVITGTQYRLWGRNSQKTIKFGITSDKYILSKITNIELAKISDSLLSYIKDCMYKDKKRTYSKNELSQKIIEYCYDSEKRFEL